MAEPAPYPRCDRCPTTRAADIVRAGDRDRYLADLFAPAAPRQHLFALHAFNVEVARIRDEVSDPTLGEIRLQWWRDAVASGDRRRPSGRGRARRDHRRVRSAARRLRRLLEARVFDLYDDPMPTLNDLEGYAGETASALIQLAAIILAGGHGPRNRGGRRPCRRRVRADAG